MGPWVAKQLDFYQKIHTGVMIPPIWSFFKPRCFFVSHDSVYAPCSCLTPLVFVVLTNSSSSCSLVNGNVHCFFHVCPSHFPIKNLFFWTAKSSSLALALEWSRSTLQKIVCRFSRLDKILCRTQGDPSHRGPCEGYFQLNNNNIIPISNTNQDNWISNWIMSRIIPIGYFSAEPRGISNWIESLQVEMHPWWNCKWTQIFDVKYVNPGWINPFIE